MRSCKPVLPVEVNEFDAMNIKRAVKELIITNNLEFVTDGEEALNYLRNQNEENPFITLLGLNMSRMNGLELLKIVKSDLSLNKIPVVIMTTFRKEHDRLESFSFSIAGFMRTPVEYKNLVEMIRIIYLYRILSELTEEY